MTDVVFVTYTHPEQQSDPQNRNLVARYIGTHFRNRSKPAARKWLNSWKLDNSTNGSYCNDAQKPNHVMTVSSRERQQPPSNDEEDALWTDHDIFVASCETASSLERLVPAGGCIQTTSIPLYPSERTFDHFKISGREADIVNWYLNEVPRMAYGTTGRGLFCPSRDIAWHATVAYPEAIIWSLIDAEGHVIANQPPGHYRSTLSRRRTLRKVQAYGVLRKMLDDPATRCSDQTFTLVCAAVAIEARFFDRHATRAHVRGLNLLIATRGGVRSMLHSTVTFGHPLTGIGFLLLAELETSGLQETLQATSQVLSQLKDMQDYPYIMFSAQPRAQFHTEICKLLNPDRSLSLLPKQLARFVTLYTLNLIILDYSRSGRDSSDFINRLNELIDGSIAIDSITGLPLVREEILTWIMAKSWADVVTLLPSDKSWQESEVRITESAIEALKVWSRLREMTKIKLLRALYGRLFENDHEEFKRSMLLDPTALDEIRRDATSSYYEKHVRNSV